MALKPLRITLRTEATLAADSSGRPVVTFAEQTVRGNAGLQGITTETPLTGTTQHGAVGMVHRGWATLLHKDTNGVAIVPSIGGELTIEGRTAAVGTWEISALEHTDAHWRVGLVRRAV